MVNITSDESEANPQKIIIGDNLYLQYQKKDSNETDNDEIEIYKSDIGKLLYIIDENNLVDQLKSSKILMQTIYRKTNSVMQKFISLITIKTIQ